MKLYARLIVLCLLGVISLLAMTVFAYAAKEALIAQGMAIDQTVFAVVVVAVLLVAYLYFVKLARVELKRLAQERAEAPPEP
jgi:formate hydrogenlyase subunit 3/multisubunit Na+/H+ antiporter MnhD subunit